MTGLTNAPEQVDDVDTHAATHYADGSDPIDLAKLGAIPASEKGKAGGVATLGEDGNVPRSQLGNAVNKTGDTMTGYLTIKSGGGVATIGVDANGLALWANNGDPEAGRYLYIGNHQGRPVGRKDDLVLNVKNHDGYGTDYIVLHTGNVTAGMTDLTAGTSALWTGGIYQVYE